MALTHQIVGTIAYLNQWNSRVVITDTSTGRLWDEELCTPTQPTQVELDALIAHRKTIIQQELDFEANDMNLTVDEKRALEYLRNIKQDIVLQVRAYPAVTLAQAQTYVDTNYPNSIVKFDKLYDFYLNLLNLSTWSEFKQFCIDEPFEGID